MADGRILIAGSRGDGGNYDVAIARRLPDGTPDPSFGAGGLVSLDFEGGVDQARGVIDRRPLRKC